MENKGTRNIIKSTILTGFLLFFLLIGLSCGSLSQNDDDMPEVKNPQIQDGNLTDTGETSNQLDASAARLSIELSDGSAQPQIAESITRVKGVPLSESEMEAILSRLPDLIIDLDDQTDFNFPLESLPPPRTGEKIEIPFPQSGDISAPPIDTGPLEIIRYSPEGEIPIAPFVNITFNQPMVPITTIEQLNQEDVPVTINPSIPGLWRWLGTKTLNFQYDSELVDRMPMATEFTVTIPAGTTSETGGELRLEDPFGGADFISNYDYQEIEGVIHIDIKKDKSVILTNR